MADDMEKTEQPTGRKLEKARESGSVIQSQEIPTVVVMATALTVFAAFGPWMGRRIIALMREAFITANANFTAETWLGAMLPFLLDTAILLAPIVAAVAVFGTLSYIAQFGFLASSEAITPDLNRLNPITGMGRFFSLRAFVDMIKGSAKVSAIGLIVYVAIRDDIGAYLDSAGQSPEALMALLWSSTFRMTVKVIIAMAVIAVIDYVYQRYDYLEKQKMTRQEVKDEFKNMEGDPKVKSRIRRLQVEMAQRRMMHEVPSADVVITNPTHVAVALRYDRGKDLAPVVIAKGRGFVALRIRAVAEASRIPILERPPLARELEKSCKLGASIPVHLYQAVAEILAYIYSLNRRQGAA
ncbi:MAG: flagellar biosynthesis protein FlhB [Deltaproteobacteria bacterium]|nr:flagellar biosynthesis protein FlhB [Deltaproteobacteria bacterium]